MDEFICARLVQISQEALAYKAAWENVGIFSNPFQGAFGQMPAYGRLKAQC